MQMMSRAGWITSLAAAAAAPPAFAQDLFKIRMPALTGDNFIEPYVAIKTGASSRAGLDIELMPLVSGGAALQAVVGGALDIGIGDAIQISNAINAGVPLAFFAGAALYTSSAPATLLVVVAKDGPIHTAKDFEGQAIGVFLSDRCRKSARASGCRTQRRGPCAGEIRRSPACGHGSIRGRAPSPEQRLPNRGCQSARLGPGSGQTI